MSEPGGAGGRTILPVASGRVAFGAFVGGLGQHRLLAVAALAITTLSSGAGVVVPLLLGMIVDLVVARAGYPALLQIVGLLVAAALATGVLTAISTRLCDQLGLTLAAGLRESAMDKALRIDAATLEQAGTGRRHVADHRGRRVDQRGRPGGGRRVHRAGHRRA